MRRKLYIKDCVNCDAEFSIADKRIDVCEACYRQIVREDKRIQARLDGSADDYDANWWEDNLGVREAGPPRTSNEWDDVVRAYEDSTV